MTAGPSPAQVGLTCRDDAAVIASSPPRSPRSLPLGDCSQRAPPGAHSAASGCPQGTLRAQRAISCQIGCHVVVRCKVWPACCSRRHAQVCTRHVCPALPCCREPAAAYAARASSVPSRKAKGLTMLSVCFSSCSGQLLCSVGRSCPLGVPRSNLHRRVLDLACTAGDCKHKNSR